MTLIKFMQINESCICCAKVLYKHMISKNFRGTCLLKKFLKLILSTPITFTIKKFQPLYALTRG